MKKKIPELKANYKLWLSLKNGDGILGDGKWRLLKAVEEYGSISKAAINLGISYRKAWGDLKKIEELLGVSIIEKHRGGNSGGSTIITPQGLMLIRSYSRFHTDFEKAFHRTVEKFLKQISVL